MQNTPSTITVAAAMDLGTLEAVRREVQARADDWRSAWRLYPGPIDILDPRLARADELDKLSTWLGERIDAASHWLDVDLDERVFITPAGLAALAAIEQAEQLGVSVCSCGDAA